jgi:signal transduction histidine kinase/CheY-like chemotaxis protein
MTAQQRIVRVRRSYNQWVANETLEDYALRFTAKSARKWSAFRVANTALGAISFLALEAIGGSITLSYGFTNAVAAILVVGLIIFATGLPIAYYAAKYGVDIDLLTRGAGFGYIGSTVTSLIYASFTFLFFALEAAIMSLALEMCFGVPLALGYMLSAIVVIPLVTHGITFISRFQLWTQPLWIGLHLLPFIFIGATSLEPVRQWTGYTGRLGAPDGSFDLMLFGAASAVVFSLIAQIGEQVDFLRFLPRDRRQGRAKWWIALLSAGPGWIVLGAFKLLAGSFLAVLALGYAVPPEKAAEPTQMYLAAFGTVASSPEIAIALTGIFVIVSQIKINVTNAYAGSLAWSNFFSRLTHSHPGRVVWLVFNVAIALVLMEIGIYKALEQILALYSIVAVAWVGSIVADLVVNKPLGLSPPHIEYKRGHLHDINPVGVGSMALATTLAIAAFSGLLGPTLRALSSFVAFFAAFAAAPLIAWTTGGRYYIARAPEEIGAGCEPVRCCICEHSFEREDMIFCPAYEGPICSLCCSLDARCHDRCKRSESYSEQILAFVSTLLPGWMVARLNPRAGHYLAVLGLLTGVIAAVLTLVYYQETQQAVAQAQVVATTLWNVFFILLVIAGVAAWLFVLAHESRKMAEEESARQNSLLMREIEAHQRTDEQLQRAKEAAEAANLAKSRFVVGISHELRTPLNAILGYAQLLERDAAIPPHRRNAIAVMRRSAEHLAGLIDWLLDISKIEAGRLELNREEVRTGEFLDQLVDMFRLHASAKGIDFVFRQTGPLPAVVYTDEKRLRQILINLVSNAIKFTSKGHVALSVRYRNQVAELEIEDTGIGIRPDDVDRIFEPFERGEAGRGTPGMGLGLTIAKLLTEIMGGDIAVTSVPGKGSTFTVKLLLFAVTQPRAKSFAEHEIRSYLGARRTVLVADDDPVHRLMVREILSPLGFIVLEAPDGPSCLGMAADARPDLYLLDISMPGLSGWQVARQLRESGWHEPGRGAIVMVSANAADLQRAPAAHDVHHGQLVKPIVVAALLDTIGRLLGLEWTADRPGRAADAPDPHSIPAAELPAPQRIEELRQLGHIGYVRGIHAKLDQIETESPAAVAFVSRMRALVQGLEMHRYMSVLEAVGRHDP